jgi:hypothetical protein
MSGIVTLLQLNAPDVHQLIDPTLACQPPFFTQYERKKPRSQQCRQEVAG